MKEKDKSNPRSLMAGHRRGADTPGGFADAPAHFGAWREGGRQELSHDPVPSQEIGGRRVTFHQYVLMSESERMQLRAESLAEIVSGAAKPVRRFRLP